MAPIDLRSDTVTRPTSSMCNWLRKEADYDSMGDDVFGDDQTVQRLERTAAEILGMEEALFVTSGTMGNLIAVMVHCEMRGSEFIVGDKAHIYYYEQGGSATLGGVHPRALHNNADGTIDLEEIENAVRAYDLHFPITRLICLEQTHNLCGGRVLTMEYIEKVAEIAKKHKLKLHCDGARLMNAVTYLGVDAKKMLRNFDSVSLCLSKGLCAPIGSVIAGSREFIEKARRLRKALGGGWRQAAVLAGPALIALTEMPARLGEDHNNAKLLGAELAKVDGFGVAPHLIQTNIVYVDLDIERLKFDAKLLVDRLRAKGVLINITNARKVRLVTHHPITEQNIHDVVAAIKSIVAAAH